MTADRDALVHLIAPHLSGGPVGSVGHMAAGWFAAQIADAILAAGWTCCPGNCAMRDGRHEPWCSEGSYDESLD